MNEIKYSVPDGLLLHDYSKDKHEENNDNNITKYINVENKPISNDIYFKMVNNQHHKNKQKTRKYRK